MVGDKCIKNCKYYYSGNDLGVTYRHNKTKFRIWAPGAKSVKLLIYDDDKTPVYDCIIDMNKSSHGTWLKELEGDFNKKYYTFKININGNKYETVGPYARAVGTNSKRGLILDMDQTNPEGWEKDQRIHLENRVDAIIYEVHIRDFSSSPFSGIKNKGKYLAFTEEGTVSSYGLKTGIDHLIELGITHVHLLPVFDFASVDDEDESQYNWGYDPLLYNVPEGSYASNPSNESRIIEFKKLIKSLHQNGIGVIMDMVYNHTYQRENSPFNLVVPDYYYRYDWHGNPANGSGCGNEIATEKPMVRKFIIESVKYWAEEYHIDGFRFDLMGLMDKETAKSIEKTLHNISSSILIYGEPWTGGISALPSELQIMKGTQRGMEISVFNDHFRNAIKGDNDGVVRGYVSGEYNRTLPIKKGVVGGIHYNDEINNFTLNPGESVNYVSAHDNLTLWDKLSKSNSEDSQVDRIKMDRLAQTIIFTSQGIPFLAGGEEFLRTKFGNHNSYNAGDKTNQLKWERKRAYFETYKYYCGLVRLRLTHPAFRMTSPEQIREHLHFIDTPTDTVGFIIDDNANNDSWRKIVVFYNPTHNQLHFPVPGIGEWQIVVDEYRAGINTINSISGFEINVNPISSLVMYQ